MRMKNKLFLFSIVAFLFSCSEKGKVFHDYQEVDNDEWLSANKLSFPVEIEDNKSTYTLQYLARYTKDYPYYNLYLKRSILDSTGKPLSSKLQGMYLFDEKSGAPKGSGWGNKYDHTILSDSNITFPYKGKYTIQLQQYMRQDTIAGISDMGISILKHE
jgi:gliding motility-associated lipoprotein GldH